jgi:hypothetical protein
MASDHFRQLSADEQALILGWIDGGLGSGLPPGQHTAAEQTERQVSVWKLVRLTPIRDSLPPAMGPAPSLGGNLVK